MSDDQPRRESTVPPEGIYPPDHWPVRWHVPYFVHYGGLVHLVVARTSERPRPTGHLELLLDGGTVADYPGLVPGSTLDLLGRRWQVTEIEHRVRIVLDRLPADPDRPEAGPTV
jgi:hypothetical protein